jgi:flavin-dependent dehydrogenase
VLGVRLLRLLETYLRKLGVELFTGFAVKKLWVEGAKYRGVVLNSPGRPQRLEARTIVLATGRFSHLIDASGDRLVPGNVFVCGGALNLSDPRTENAVAVVTGFRAGMRAAKLGAQPCGKMTGDSITA